MSIHLEKTCPPLLIIGFRRSKNLAELLDQAKTMGAPRIYVALDGPRNSTDWKETQECESVVRHFEELNPSLIRIRQSTENLGSAVSVLSACDWIFSTEDFAIIMEDDCRPSPDFFKYVADAESVLSNNSRAMLICGTQFAPELVTGNRWSYSSYPLMWGWATSKVKWNLLRGLVLGRFADENEVFDLRKTELIYWKEGARRALEGFVDAWDIPLVYGMRRLGLLTILPPTNLVVNSGNDEYATHTLGTADGLNRVTEPYFKSEIGPEFNPDLDKWLSRNFYGISFRHRFSTQITKLFDALGFNARKRAPLRNRWN